MTEYLKEILMVAFEYNFTLFVMHLPYIYIYSQSYPFQLIKLIIETLAKNTANVLSILHFQHK